MTITTISQKLKADYGQKIYRLSLTSGCTCPNRDGTVGVGGCTFCSEGGSGDFAAPYLSVEEQIQTARKKVDHKIPKAIKPEDRRYIAYFQSFTNTYARNAEELERLRNLYTEVLRRPEIVILSLGTRPDCLSEDILDMLDAVHRCAPEKEIWIEMGLQTIHDKTAERIQRGYPYEVFEDALQRTKARGFSVIVHVILGLPQESREEMLETVQQLADLQPAIDGIKLQLLHVLSGTVLGSQYLENPFPIMEMEEYCDLVAECLQILPPEVVIHRMTGDGPKSLLIAPKWSADKKRVLNMLNKKIRELP